MAIFIYFLTSTMNVFGNMSFGEAYTLSKNTPALVKRLQDANVLARQLTCDTCNNEMIIQQYARYSEGLCWRCTSSTCRLRKSIRDKSYFEKHKLPLGSLFMIIYCYLKYDKMLQMYIADICDVSEKTMVDWGNYI